MRNDAAKYAAKHPVGIPLDPVLGEALGKVAIDGEIPCSAAFRVAEETGAAPDAVGQAMDLLEYRITKCQLGLFGYGAHKKIVRPAEEVSEELRLLLESSSHDGRVSCAACWALAEQLGLPRLAVAAACDRLGLKITPCQLGAF
jgi:hypothetical protein